MSDGPTTLNLQAAPRGQKLTESVAQSLIAEMRARRLEVGARMPSERELQTALGVGRSTIREALTGLAMMGLVEIRHGRGVFVTADPAVMGATEGIATALSKGVTRTLLEARRPVEVEIAGLAAERRSGADLKALRTVLTRHERTLERDRTAAHWSAQFHLVLSEAAHNEVLAGFVASYRRLLEDRGPRLEGAEGYREWELAEHTGLFEAVEAQDVAAARDRMGEHLEGVLRFYRLVGWPLD